MLLSIYFKTGGFHRVLHISLHTCKPRNNEIVELPNNTAAAADAAIGVLEQPGDVTRGEVHGHSHDQENDSDSTQQEVRMNTVNESTANSSTVRSLEDAHRILFGVQNVFSKFPC